MVVLPAPLQPVIHRVAPFCFNAAKRVEDGRWQALCDSPSEAAEHSIMWGGVEASAAARRAPISIWEGSTLPLQSHEEEEEEELLSAVEIVEEEEEEEGLPSDFVGGEI